MDVSAFTGHQVWRDIEATLEALDGSNVPENMQHQAQRVHQIAALATTYVNASAASTYAVFVSPQMLENLRVQWVNVQSHVSNHVSNVNAGYLQHADQYLDGVLSTLAAWPTQGLRGGAAAQAARIFEAYQEQAKKIIADQRQEIQSLKDVHADHASAEAALKDKIAALEAKIIQEETRLDSAITKHVTAFNDAQSMRAESFEKWLNDRKLDLQKAAASQTAELDVAVQHAAAIREQLEDLQVKTESVAGATASAAIARDYSARAAKEETYGFRAYIAGFVIMIGALGFLGYVLVHEVGTRSDVSWQFVALRLGLTVALAAVAGVAFALGRGFLQSSRTNKRIDLELRALGPFLADVEEDDEGTVRQAKLDFLARTFGRTWDGTGHSVADDTPSAATLQKLVDIVAILASPRGNG